MNEKKRYVLAPLDDEVPRAVCSLDEAIAHLREWFADQFVTPGDEWTCRIVEMTEEEVSALPDL